MGGGGLRMSIAAVGLQLRLYNLLGASPRPFPRRVCVLLLFSARHRGVCGGTWSLPVPPGCGGVLRAAASLEGQRHALQ